MSFTNIADNRVAPWFAAYGQIVKDAQSFARMARFLEEELAEVKAFCASISGVADLGDVYAECMQDIARSEALLVEIRAVMVNLGRSQA